MRAARPLTLFALALVLALSPDAPVLADDVGGDVAEGDVLAPLGRAHGASAVPGHASREQLVATAAGPHDSPARREARDRLFRTVVPSLRDAASAPSALERAALEPALAGSACVAGTARVVKAGIDGDLAWVAAAGGRGGCTWLLVRDERGWSPLMPLGWTLGY